jgi:hypothetical protein
MWPDILVAPSNKGLHQTRRGGAAASRPVVEARLAGEAWCSTGLRALCVFALALSVSACAPHDPEAEKQLVLLYNRISPGTTESDVEQWVGESTYSKLKLNRSYAQLAVITPPQDGAKNWIICMDVRDKRVIRARIGTVDSCQEQPEAAPPPKEMSAGNMQL